MEPEGSSPHSQEPATCPSWARLIQSMTPQSKLSKMYFYPLIYAWVFQVVSFPHVPPLKHCMHLSSSPYMLELHDH
jgi:hypothetical protein